MSNTNVVVVSGNLGADVESSATGGGKMVANIRLAVNKHIPDGQGGFTTSTSWISVKSFGNLAERMIEKLSKGSKVSITGELYEEAWQDKQSGANRSKLIVIASSFENLGGGDKANQSNSALSNQNQNQNSGFKGKNNGNGYQGNGSQHHQPAKNHNAQERPPGY